MTKGVGGGGGGGVICADGLHTFLCSTMRDHMEKALGVKVTMLCDFVTKLKSPQRRKVPKQGNIKALESLTRLFVG